MILHVYKKRDNRSDCPPEEIAAACASYGEMEEMAEELEQQETMVEEKEKTGISLERVVSQLRIQVMQLTKKNSEYAARVAHDAQKIGDLERQIALLQQKLANQEIREELEVRREEKVSALPPTQGNSERKTPGSVRAHYEQPVSRFDRFMSQIEAFLPYPLFLKRRKTWRKMRKLRRR